MKWRNSSGGRDNSWEAELLSAFLIIRKLHYLPFLEGKDRWYLTVLFIFLIKLNIFLMIKLYCVKVKRRKNKCLQLKQLNLMLESIFTQTVWIPLHMWIRSKNAQHNLILTFKYYTSLPSEKYMILQKHEGFVTYHFWCSGWNGVVEAIRHPPFMLYSCHR